MIDKTAIIDSKAKLEKNVQVGPYCIIGPNVEIGENTIIQSHVNISGNVEMSGTANIAGNVFLGANITVGTSSAGVAMTFHANGDVVLNSNSTSEFIKLETKRNELFSRFDKELFYFNHSYIFHTDKKNVIGKTENNTKFASIISAKKTVGFQFHPEKSQKNGIKLLENF